jgi:hypothetical protein
MKKRILPTTLKPGDVIKLDEHYWKRNKKVNKEILCWHIGEPHDDNGHFYGVFPEPYGTFQILSGPIAWPTMTGAERYIYHIIAKNRKKFTVWVMKTKVDGTVFPFDEKLLLTLKMK